MKRWLMVVPLAVFLLVAVFLYKGLSSPMNCPRQ